MQYDYQWADSQLTGRCKTSRKMANNTYLKRRSDNEIALLLHNTDIATYRDDGTVELNSGGWLTVTTKERLNRFTDASIWSTNGVWTISISTGHGTWEQRNEGSVVWAEGVTLHPGGDVTGFMPRSEEAARDKRNRVMRARIKRFIKSITADRIIGAWENSGGDCFICRAMGSDSGCLASHLEDNYFHASLALNAVKAANYNNPDFIMSMIYHDALQGDVNETLTRTLGKFLRKNLMEGVATQ